MPALNDTVQLSVVGVVSGQDHIHTLNFRCTDIGVGKDDLINSWQASCRTAYRALFYTDSSPCVRYVAQHICGTVPLEAPTEEVEAVGSILGTRGISGDPLPPWIATVSSVRTALSGRSRRGRFFLGGLREVDQALDVLDAGTVTLLQAYHTTLISTFGPGGTDSNWDMVVHSRLLASVPGTDCDDSSTPVTGILARTFLGTMKSRKAGSGT